MEAFVAVATAQSDESQLSSGTNLDSTSFASSCRSLGNSSSSLVAPGRQGFPSHLLPHHHVSDLSRRELLDNGHYWKYLVGGESSSNMVPQEPTMAANDGVSKTPSPSSNTSAVAGEETSASAVRSSTMTTNNSSNPTDASSKELPGIEDVLSLTDVDRDDDEEDESSPNNGRVLSVNTPPNLNNNKGSSTKGHRSSPGGGGESTGSDVERFDGKIVYNPDGSAYIIEDSEMSEDDGSLDVPHLEGCIVDGRGVSLGQIPAIPHIANAIYVSRNPALYNALYGQAYSSSLLQDKKIVPDIPIMHSYRVYSIRDKSGDRSGVDEDHEEDDEEMDEEGNLRQGKKRDPTSSSGGGGSRTNGNNSSDVSNKDSSSSNNKSTSVSECSSVPIKPILMCFICKLSFGYTKSFIAHAMGDHNLILIDQEKDVLNQRNVSAIIQPVGKNKDPTISFLEPVSNRVPGQAQQQSSVNQQSCSALHQSSVPMNRPPLHLHQSPNKDLPLFRSSLLNHSPSDDNANNIKSSPINSPDHLLLASPRPPHSVNSSDNQSQLPNRLPNNNPGIDLTRKSPGSGRSSASPGANISPSPSSSTPAPLMNSISPSGSQMSLGGTSGGGPPNFITGTTIGVCPEHINGRPSGVDCSKCEMILNSSRMGALGNLHTRNSCKTLKCPKCNWHYKYQETLEIHMKEKHPDNETSCIYCIAGQPHPRLARGETYTCGYKPYRCEVCNYSTTTKGNLSIHMQSDKHLNNMQELQNGGVPPPESLVQQTAPSSHKSLAGMSPSPGGASAPPPNNPKPKPTFRCDVCNYETNVARNLRIHMTSEKHTHNMMVLQQNVKHMQHLSALQQAQNPFDPAALLQFHPGLAGMGGGGGGSGNVPGGSGNDKQSPHAEAAIADMAYNQALLIQMMTGGQMPPHIPPELAPHMDLGLNPDTMEPPPEPPDQNPSHLFQCCVCTVYVTDSLEALSHHLTQDRTKLREQEILVLVAGNYMCKLCSYKTNLKANFQLHCKTDKHLQRLQHVNHVKEGGLRNEWKLKYLSMSNPVQVRCNACDYYTNSAHKLQLHAAHQRHEISVHIFRHLHSHEASINEDCRIYACALCGFTTRVKLQLLQHTRSLKHLQLEQLHCLQRRAEGKDGQPDLAQVFRVLEQPDSDSSGHNNHSSTSAAVSPNFYNDHDMKDLRREEGGSNSVLKNALEKDSSDSNDLTCPFCTFTTESETRLQAHVLTQHSNSELSGSSGSSRERERLRDASNKDPSSSSTSRHRVHRRSSSPETSKVDGQAEGMTCPLCQDSCSDRSSLELHVMQVHSVNSEGLQRLLLLVNQSHWLNSSRSSGGNNVSSSSDMRSESNDDDKDKSESESALEDTSDSDEFRCQTCAKCFRTLDDLCCHQNELGHLEIKQTPGGPGYLCWKKGCNQYFPTAPSLQMHFREIHARGKQAMAVSEKHVYKYRCNECSLAFKTQEKLQLHSQYHAIRDASKCCLCGRSFRSLAALQKHVETSHTELSEDELQQFKMSLASNPLLLAGLTGQILDPVTTELLKKESARDEEMMSIDDDGRGDDSMLEKDDLMALNESGGDGDSNDSIGTKEQQLIEDYLNTQAMAEDSYNDPNRKYKCHRCKVAFTRQSYLTSHNKTLLHRKGEKLSYPMEKYLDPNRPYKCEVCKESFTQKNILLVHYNSVSHLHKLKRAMQEQQQLLGQIPSSLTASLPPSATNLVTPNSKGTGASSSNTTSASTPPSSVNVSSSPSIMSDDDDKKPYKCNICKVAYSQGSTLDIHMRSVLHQTRASKLQELAMTGQIDLTKPLIEQPEPQKLQDQHKKIMQDMLSPKGDGNAPVSFSTPIRSSSPVSSSQSHGSNTSPPNTSVSPIVSASPHHQSSSSSNYSCPRCNFNCSSQDQLLQHQHLYCMFQTSMSLFPPLPSPNSSSTPNTSAILESQSTPRNSGDGPADPSPSPSPSPMPLEEHIPRFNIPSKKSSHMFKHLLESYGFEVVMQFNEYHQKRLKHEELEEDSFSMEEQMSKEFPELAKSACPYCKKVFSSVWILKAHCEEIHKNVISMEILENFAEAFRGEYLKKVESAAAAAAEASDKELMELESSGANKESAGGASSSSKTNLASEQGGTVQVNPTAPSTPTASTTPASSSAESVSGNNSSSTAVAAVAAAAAATAQAGHSNNIPMSIAQHMNDVQAALNAMAASQLQHFNPMLNPMMMAAGLGMGLPLGLNMNALAAMNLQPPLMMMPPQFEHMNMNQLNQSSGQNSMFPQRMENSANAAMAKQQQQMMQQQQQQAAAAAAAATASNQKRARTRITDEQLKILRAHFDINNSPSEEQIQQMAAQSGLPPKVIKHWFRNTLFKERQRNKDSPYNFSNPPSTTLNLEEYEKTGEAKVMPLPLEEQKQYTDAPPPTPSKKESHKKSSQQGHSSAHSSLSMPQHEPIDMNKYMNSHDSQSELSETESRHEDEKPIRLSHSSKGGSHHHHHHHGSSSSSSPFGSLSAAVANAMSQQQQRQEQLKNSLGSGVPDQNMSSSPGSLTSLITSQMNSQQEDSNSSRHSQNMLPPPKMSSFATPSQVPNNSSSTSLLSLASPVSINSPGSGRSDTPLTTPPLPNCANNASSSSSSGKRANRTRFTDYQIKVLQEFFENNAYPKDDDLEYLSKLLSLSPRVIVVWFQNARQKARKVYENQPPVDSSGDESAGRFQRTPGLNYQCKKCLLVFQRYYELIRHQKTHCFKEEDAKRSAQAQAAAAQVAAAMSSEDSNSSIVTDNNSMASSCGPSPAAPNTGGVQQSISRDGSIAAASASQNSNNSSSIFNTELKKLESQSDSFQCDKCNLVFPRFDLWREHQLVHIMNPNLFPSFSPDSPFGILQQHAHTQQQQQLQQQQQQSGQRDDSGQSSVQAQRDRQRESDLRDQFNESLSATSSVAGDATTKRKWSADEQTDDGNDDQPRDKRLRTTILPEQLDYLYQKYQIESNPSRKMLETIAREVGLKKRVVQVWFQNTRARERKGQFRAHAQVINKRCPFCPALFKVKSALETHLTAKHADQYTKGDINIDALPDEEIDNASSPLGDNTKVPISFGANSTNSLGAAPTSPPSNIMAPFLHSLSTHAELESSLKKLYEESIKRYSQEFQAANTQNGRSGTQTPTDLQRFVKSEVTSPGPTGGGGPNPTGDTPLDLSKPVDLTRAFKSEMMDTSFLDSQDYLSDGDDLDTVHDSNPNSPASSTASQKRPSAGLGPGTNSGNKRFRTQLAAFQVKVMKSLFADYKTPTMAECEMLGHEIGLAKRVIQVWFQNARAKDKKNKLSVQKGGEEPDSPKLPEECKFCGLKYSHKYSIQDHIFTKKHIDMIKVSLDSGKSFPSPPTDRILLLPPIISSCSTDPKVSTGKVSVSPSQSSSTLVAEESMSSRLINILPSTSMNGEEATLLQQLQFLQQMASKSVPGSSFPSSSAQQPPPQLLQPLIQGKVSFSANINVPTTTEGIGGSCTTTTTSSGLSSEEINLLQLYGLGTSTSSLVSPAPSTTTSYLGASVPELVTENEPFKTMDDIEIESKAAVDATSKSLPKGVRIAGSRVQFNSSEVPATNMMRTNFSSECDGLQGDIANEGMRRNIDLIPRIQDVRKPDDNSEVSKTSSDLSPMSAGLSSEMDYVVQTIAALAQAKSRESTDSNANVRIDENKSN